MAIKSKKATQVAENDLKDRQQQNKQRKKPSKPQRKKRKRRPKHRAFPILLRLVMIVVLCAVALILGAMVGYAMLGDGEPGDIFQVKTWQHIIDIVTKE